MLTNFFITFRETFEIVLVVGVVLRYLKEQNNLSFKKNVYLGVFTGILLSLFVAFGISMVGSNLRGPAERIFESAVLFGGAGFILYMVLWLRRQASPTAGIQHKLAGAVATQEKMGVFFLVLFVVFREAVEAVLYLEAAGLANASNGLLGALVGIAAALVLGYLLFVEAKRLPVKKLLTITTVFLIFFGANLLAHGIHEWQEAPVDDVEYSKITPGALGGFIEAGQEMVFGHEGDVNGVEVISWAIYIVGAGALVKRRKN